MSWRGLAAGVLIAAATASLAAERRRHPLEGTWTGDGLTLRIDPRSAQANRDPSRPFAWQGFWVENVTGSLVTFVVGNARFIGRLEDDVLTVTETGHAGSWRLARGPLVSRGPAPGN